MKSILWKMKNITGLELALRNNLDTEIGYIKAAQAMYRFNDLYNKKHKNDDKSDFHINRALRFYTLSRYLSRRIKIK